MAVPIDLNLPVTKSVNLGLDIGAGVSNKQFSEHFDRNVERLSDKGRSTNGVKHNMNESLESKHSDRAERDRSSSKTLTKSNTVSDGKTQLGDVSHGSAGVEESHDETVDVPLVITAIVDKAGLFEGLGLSFEGGNSLPITAESVPSIQAIDEEFLDAEAASSVITGDIVFDPLAQAADSSAQIASMMVSNPLPADKIKLNGKSGVGDFLNPFKNSLLLEKVAQADIPALMTDKLFKADALTNLGNEFGLVKPTITVDLPLNNVAGAVSQSINMSPLTADKPIFQLDTPVSSARWGQEFSQRIQWMVNQSVSGAQIRITPQNMGPIEVRVQIHNDQATISFTAQHGATREAIDAALPRLRDMLSEQQVDLVDVDVSQHSFAEQQEKQLANQSGDEQAGDVSTSDAFDNDESISNSMGGPSTIYTGLFNKYA